MFGECCFYVFITRTNEQCCRSVAAACVTAMAESGEHFSIRLDFEHEHQHKIDSKQVEEQIPWCLVNGLRMIPRRRRTRRFHCARLSNNSSSKLTYDHALQNLFVHLKHDPVCSYITQAGLDSADTLALPAERLMGSRLSMCDTLVCMIYLRFR